MFMQRNLPRLDPSFYAGKAYVFWTHTTEDRGRFELNDSFHFRFREILTHVCFRYQLVTPAYCIMPDHVHLLWIGYADDADQKQATRFFRKELRSVIAPCVWQRQPHEHVVREQERKSGIYADTIRYILNNPVRADLAERWQDYAFIGSMLPGYPHIDLRQRDFRELFWKVYQKLAEAADAGKSK